MIEESIRVCLRIYAVRDHKESQVRTYSAWLGIELDFFSTNSTTAKKWVFCVDVGEISQLLKFHTTSV